MKRPLTIAFLVFLLGAKNLSAGPSAPASIQALADQADLVTVATVLASSQSGNLVSFTLQLDRVLKGGASEGSTIFVQWESGPNLPAVQEKWLVNLRGLWFLRELTSGRWKALPTVLGSALFMDAFFSIPVGPIVNAFSYSPTAPVIDKVISELGAATEQQNASAPGGSFRVLAGLQGVKSPLIASMYQRFSESASPNLRALGLAGLLRLGETAALSRAETELPNLSKTKEFQNIVVSVCSYFRNPDPSAVAILGRLSILAGASPELASCAVIALRHMHTRESLPFLVVLLDSADRRIRYQAVAGLASFANMGHVPLEEKLRARGQYVATTRGPYTTDETLQHFPTLPAFENNEAQYINFWKSWWNRVQPLLQP